MKTIKLINGQTNLEQLLELARGENILIKIRDEEFLLAPIDDFEAEVESLRYNEDFIAFLDARAKERKIPIKKARDMLLEST